MSPPAPKITKTSALYTLIINGQDNTYEIKVNNESQKKGSLLDDFSPPFSPPEEIDDDTDEKPADWVEQPKIAVSKPEQNPCLDMRLRLLTSSVNFSGP